MAPKELRTVLSPLLLSHDDPTEQNGEGILNHVAIWIWITANSYVRLDDDCAVEDRHEQQFCLSLTDTDKHEQCLSIHASTLEESIVCLDYLVGLHDTHFLEMGICEGDALEMDPRLCPFGTETLEKMLQNSTRRIAFNCMIFTPDHCRILASSGTKTNIEFFRCEFQDEGAAFVEASTARQDETSGPAKLRFVSNNPFNDRNWIFFLSHHKLESLELKGVLLNSEVSCRAVATSQVRCLTLSYDCELEDGGAALVESVRQGLGPKEIFFVDCDPFDSSERLITFMSALRGNTNLERLELPLIDDRQVKQALVAALRENEGLVYLKVKYCGKLDESDITDFLGSISLQPSLRSLDLTVWYSGTNLKKRREFTKAVADMLSVNDRVEVMSFDHDIFDKYDWNAYVVPRLECNLYRKRFLSAQKIEEASTRAAVLARTLVMFSKKPYLVWMLLNQNRDIVSSYLDSAHDQTSILSRKRSRSPSLDGMSAAH
jgi:hypothetical protein